MFNWQSHFGIQLAAILVHVITHLIGPRWIPLDGEVDFVSATVFVLP